MATTADNAATPATNGASGAAAVNGNNELGAYSFSVILLSRIRVDKAPCLTTNWLTCFLIGVIKLDPWLGPFKGSLERRYAKAHEWIKKIDDVEGGVEKFSKVRHTRHNN